jgi:hypothetical protein
MALLPALGLAGCGGIDSGSIENLIKSKNADEPGATVQSAKCPGSIADKASQKISCSTTLTTSAGKQESGSTEVTLEHNNVTAMQFTPSGGGPATPATPSTPATTTT